MPNFRLHLSSALFLEINYRLEISLYIKLKEVMSNSWDHYEPSHLDLRCLQMPIIIAYGREWVNSIFIYLKFELFQRERWLSKLRWNFVGVLNDFSRSIFCFILKAVSFQTTCKLWLAGLSLLTVNLRIIIWSVYNHCFREICLEETVSHKMCVKSYLQSCLTPGSVTTYISSIFTIQVAGS